MYVQAASRIRWNFSMQGIVRQNLCVWNEEEVLDWFFSTATVWKGHFDQWRIIGTVLGSYRVILLFNDEILNIG